MRMTGVLPTVPRMLSCFTILSPWLDIEGSLHPNLAGVHEQGFLQQR